MSDLKSGILELNDGGTLYYETAGEGQALVLSHAAFVDSRMFDAQWEELAQHYQVIRYDMQGFGRSGAVSGPVCRRDDLRQLLQHLGVDRAHFVGCSLSGELVLDLALEQPHLVLSLTLVGATPSGFELIGEPPRYIMEMFGAMQSGDLDTANELQIRIWLDGSYREPEAMNAELREKALMMNRIPVERGTFFIADTQPLTPLDPPAITRLQELQCPVLVVAGTLDHAEVLRAADVMTKGIPNARKILIESAGHVPSYEQPQVFNQHLIDFLHEIEKSSV